MKMPRKRTLLLIPLALFAVVYIGAAVMLALRNDPIATFEKPAGQRTIAIFGASGTAGDGILKAALASPDIRKNRTRRISANGSSMGSFRPSGLR